MSISKIVRFMVAAFSLTVLVVAPAMAQPDTTSKAAKPLDSIHDTVPNSFKGKFVTIKAGSPKSMEDNIEDLLAQKPIPWTASDQKKGIEANIQDMLFPGPNDDKSGPTSCGLTGIYGPNDIYPILINKGQVYIFHILTWTREEVNNTGATKDVRYKMRSSSWYAYVVLPAQTRLPDSV
jgi:hypothetical protein